MKYYEKEKRKKIQTRYGKKCGFLRIWAKVAIPFAALTAVILMIGTTLVLALVINGNMSRAMEVCWEQNAVMEGLVDSNTDSGNQQKLLSESVQTMLNMDIFNIVAILYNPDGQKVACSKVSEYNNHGSKEKNIYADMLSVIEKKGVEGESDSELKLYGYSYLYDSQKVNIGNKVYILQYAAVIAPWKEHIGKFVLTWFVIILFMTLLSLLIAHNFYKLMRARLIIEKHRCDTTNAMAHDLKTPLMAISGYAENLRENVHTEKKDYYADAISRNVGEMNHIVENMLELAKVENVEIILNKENVNLREMTEQVMEQFQSAINKKTLQVEMQGEAQINADKALMKRVLENLIGNAMKYTPDKQKISIRMEDHQYQITNTGVTIAASQLEEMWKPFVKGDNARGSGNGTGIGLALVKEILDVHFLNYALSSGSDSVTVTIYF